MTIAKSIAQAWIDADDKAKLLSDPHAALADVGFKVPAGNTLKVLEDTAETQHLVLPVSLDNNVSLGEFAKSARGWSSPNTSFFSQRQGGDGNMTVAKSIARARTDADYKASLLRDPLAALSEHGVEVPEGATVKVVENTHDTHHLVLPVAPAEAGEITLDELEKVAGGIGAMLDYAAGLQCDGSKVRHIICAEIWRLNHTRIK